MELTLKDPSDLLLVQKVQKEGCENSLMRLYEKHEGLCTTMYDKYKSSLMNTGISPEDVSDHCIEVVYNAAKGFKPEKNVKFSTHLGNYIRYQCLTALDDFSVETAMSPEMIQEKIDESVSSLSGNQIPIYNTFDFSNAFSILDTLKDSRIKRVFELKYLSLDCSWRKIGREMGLSVPTVQKLHEKGLKVLQSKFKKDKV